VAGTSSSTGWTKQLARWWPFLLVVVAAVAFFVVRAGSGSGGDNGAGSDTSDAGVTTIADPAAGNQVGGGPVFACTGDEGAGQPAVDESELPRQADDTIDLIAAGGPFPYDQDGAVFQNREGELPAQGAGYYHEYTVVTPGSSDRGARRIVAGACGELYYTDDHYDTFRLVVADS
jgi:ribonuclease T1